MRDRTFKSSLIHASVIIRFPEFAEFSESSAQFGKPPVQVQRRDNAFIMTNARVRIDFLALHSSEWEPS